MRSMVGDISVRPATDADIDALIAPYSAFFREDGITVDAAQIARNLALMIADPRAIILVACVDKAIVGLASASTTHGVEFGCAAEFEDLFVIPEMRGRGLARTLVLAIIDWAESMNADIIALVITAVAENDQGLSAFYERLGFETSDRLTMYRMMS